MADVYMDSTEHSTEIKERFRLDTRKKIFIVRVVRHWNRFSKGNMGAPYLEHQRPVWMGL